jgi:hypothetical protein
MTFCQKLQNQLWEESFMKTQKSFFEQNGGTYTQVGDVLLPALSIEEAEQRFIGKYGRMRKRYLKEQHPVIFSELLLSGKLYPHLLEIDEACQGRIELFALQMAKREGVTEKLKAADQMDWVRHMNSIRSRAEEIVLHELIYAEEAEDADT